MGTRVSITSPTGKLQRRIEDLEAGIREAIRVLNDRGEDAASRAVVIAGLRIILEKRS